MVNHHERKSTIFCARGGKIVPPRAQKKGINALVGKLQNEFEVDDIKPAAEFAADLW